MNFDKAFQIIISEEVEGGYSNDSNDPGGATRYGITEATARAHGYSGSMRDLPLEIAHSIYWTSYWKPCRCDEMPWPLSMFVFDAAVNQGVNAAKQMLQKTLGTVQDGIIGPVTIKLANNGNAWHRARFMAVRCQRYQSTRNYDRFGTGWLTRLFTVWRLSE